MAGAGAAEGAAEAPAVPCRLVLPVVPAARVIGKGGAGLRAIRERSGASVRILQRELPREMQRREDRVALIAGGPEAVREAIAGVLERVFDRSGLPDAATRSKDRTHVVEVLVPEKSGAHLVGQRGERVKALIEETGCDIHVVKEPLAGLAEQKRVRVTGATAEEAVGAVCSLQDVLSELAAAGVLRPEHFELRESAPPAAPGGEMAPARGAGRETPVRVLLAKEEAAWVVGRRGSKIARLRDFARVQMNDADAPPFESSERILEITAAPLEQRMRVVGMLVDDLAQRQEASGELRMLVPTEHFGSVMGHRGETIRGIMQATGASLQQHKAERTADGGEYHLRLVRVRGDARQRAEAAQAVQRALEQRGRPGDAAPPPGGAGAAAPGADLGAGLGLGLGLGSGPGLGPAPVPVPAPAPAAARGTAARPHAGTGAEPRPRAGAGAGAGASAAGGLGPGAGACGTAAAAPAAPAAAAAPVAPEGEGGGELALQLAMPSEEVAEMLASEASGIAWRAGVRLAAGHGAGGIPILEVVGTAVGNSVACYLVQDRLFLMH